MTHPPHPQEPAAAFSVGLLRATGGRDVAGAPDEPRNASALRPGRFAFVPMEAYMFEDQSQVDIEELIKTSPEFKQLYQRHQKLDKKVMDAELGVLPIDDTTLGQMKREKLAAKDRLIQMYDRQQ